MLIKIRTKHTFANEAIQFTEELAADGNYQAVENWCHGSLKGTCLEPSERVIELRCCDNYATANVGDYIVKQSPNSFCVYNPEQFEQMFERIASGQY